MYKKLNRNGTNRSLGELYEKHRKNEIIYLEDCDELITDDLLIKAINKNYSFGSLVYSEDLEIEHMRTIIYIIEGTKILKSFFSLLDNRVFNKKDENSIDTLEFINIQETYSYFFSVEQFESLTKEQIETVKYFRSILK